MKKAKNFARKFLLDATMNYIFFIPLFIVLNTVPFFFNLPYWSMENAITYAVTGLFGSFLLGGVYGRVLNAWRRKMKYE